MGNAFGSESDERSSQKAAALSSRSMIRRIEETRFWKKRSNYNLLRQSELGWVQIGRRGRKAMAHKEPSSTLFACRERCYVVPRLSQVPYPSNHPSA